ncbi:MAG: hypothetical protein ACI92Z_002324 [Paracoccaceae bacterium]|jgi:hypothetical protein
MTLTAITRDVIGPGIQVTLASGDDRLITEGTTVLSTDSTVILGTSDNIIYVYGSVYGAGLGIVTQGDNNKVVVGATGSVGIFTEFGSVGFSTSAAGNNGEIINHGTISGGMALYASLGLNARFENTGFAIGTEVFVFENMDSGSVNRIYNSGYAQGTSYGVNILDNAGTQISYIYNSGHLGGDVAAISGSGDIKNVYNSGMLFGNINLGDGNDLFDGCGGTVQNGAVAGGAGDDTYIVDDLSVVLVEGVSEGIDTVQSEVNWRLANNFENLELFGNN